MKKIIKNFLSIIILISSLLFLSIATTAPSYAVDPKENTTSSPKTSGAEDKAEDNSSTTGFGGRDCPNFLGLTSWDCGFDESQVKNEDGLKKGILIIVSNVATDIVIIAAILVLGYVIYGGYLYILSGGDPGKVASGKKTLTQAFIGLGIVLSARLIMGTIRIVLIGGEFKDCVSEKCVNPNDMVQNLITWFISIAGIVSAIFLVYGGISYITSSGDPGKVQKAKQIILYSLIGLVIVALSVMITAFVSNMINNAQTADIIKATIIAKEIK